MKTPSNDANWRNSGRRGLDREGKRVDHIEHRDERLHEKAPEQLSSLPTNERQLAMTRDPRRRSEKIRNGPISSRKTMKTPYLFSTLAPANFQKIGRMALLPLARKSLFFGIPESNLPIVIGAFSVGVDPLQIQADPLCQMTGPNLSKSV
jgi:hypothetical protein